ncbi:MAG TPA: DNA translocase FtsK 4TM domain-containing protein [Candidatus Acidoferrum sp.]|nr:DNA translocase FtsK 4TM domain-containing protein [Candidatus Acidoferrum sp.]
MARKKGHKGKKTLGAILVLLALFLLVSLFTHRTLDDARIRGEVDGQLNPFSASFGNQAGMVGAYLSFLLLFLFGWLACFLPLGMLSLSVRLFSEDLAEKVQPRISLLFVVAVLGTMIYNVHSVLGANIDSASDAIGGYAAELLTRIVTRLIGETGTYLILGGMIVILLLLYTYFTPFLLGHLRKSGAPTMKRAFVALASGAKWFFSFKWLVSSSRTPTIEPKPEATPAFDTILKDEMNTAEVADHSEAAEEGAEDQAEVSEPKKSPKRSAVLKKAAEPVQIRSFNYAYPGLDVLDANPSDSPTVSNDELTATAKMLKETLETFGVSIEGNIDRYPGPVITRYEFKPGTGIKVNQIVNLADDLALALKAKRIRIIAPIPGKAAVGVEIPNRSPQKVYLRDILSSTEFTDSNMRLPLAFGKTTAGKPFVADLSRMPHLLIAGATGSGKSVCMNVLITSLIYRMHPLQVRFIFVDPKMLELSVYSGIPHLGRPVVTTPRQAEKVFSDAVIEMENRYRRLAAASVRNIEDYNRKQAKEEDKLPYIILFVDELADLMMSATSSKTELLITRLAQMARAVGIHLVLATQRPSVDVITGLIKANFPARIAFQVSSKVDSRTIIDANGAEKLLGAGDMLFLSTGQPEPVRVHGAYISSEETDRMVKFIRDQGLGMLALENISQSTGEASEAEVDIGDPLFREACEVVIRHKQGSVSLLQRRLGIGYQRAARLIDKLEEAGVVSPFDGSKAREVIVDKSYLDILFANSSGSVKSDAEPN